MIKKILNPGNYPKNIDFALLLLRVAGGSFMLTHGMGKFFKLIGDAPIKFSDPIGIGVSASLSLVVFAEVFCSILLILGLLTRLATLPLLITMLVVAFIVNANNAFSKQELSLLYGIIFLAITISGPGKYSIDNFLFKKMH